MRTGRLTSGYFKRQEPNDLPSRYLRWDNQIIRAAGVLTNATWFSLDNETGAAEMVNHNDVDGHVLWQLAGYLEGDEAVAIVNESAFGDYTGKRQWNPTEADGPIYRPPPGVITGGQLSSSSVRAALTDCLAMAAFVVVQNRIYMLGTRWGLDGGVERLEFIPREAVPGLFSDS